MPSNLVHRLRAAGVHLLLSVCIAALSAAIVFLLLVGVENADVMRIIEMNVRIPERAMGDMRAQIAAVNTGEKRFQEMIAKYGCEAVLTAIEAIFDQSEAAAREAIERGREELQRVEEVEGERPGRVEQPGIGVAEREDLAQPRPLHP